MQYIARYVIKEISDTGFDTLANPIGDISSYVVRLASRGLLFEEKKIALLHATVNNYHKLPGGGVERDETSEQAFQREIMEETGCLCNSPEESGVTIEYRGQMNELQISYIFKAEVTQKTDKQNFTNEELANGFQLKWVTLSEAQSLLLQDKPIDYEGKFINQRDLAIINFYLQGNL